MVGMFSMSTVGLRERFKVTRPYMNFLLNTPHAQGLLEVILRQKRDIPMNISSETFLWLI